MRELGGSEGLTVLFHHLKHLANLCRTHSRIENVHDDVADPRRTHSHLENILNSMVDDPATKPQVQEYFQKYPERRAILDSITE